MAEADLAALIPDPMPQWLQRAMDPSTSATDQNETVRTTSFYSKQHGGELLVPTIRMGEEGLYKPEDPLQEALDLITSTSIKVIDTEALEESTPVD